MTVVDYISKRVVCALFTRECKSAEHDMRSDVALAITDFGVSHIVCNEFDLVRCKHELRGEIVHGYARRIVVDDVITVEVFAQADEVCGVNYDFLRRNRKACILILTVDRRICDKVVVVDCKRFADYVTVIIVIVRQNAIVTSAVCGKFTVLVVFCSCERTAYAREQIVIIDTCVIVGFSERYAVYFDYFVSDAVCGVRVAVHFVKSRCGGSDLHRCGRDIDDCGLDVDVCALDFNAVFHKFRIYERYDVFTCEDVFGRGRNMRFPHDVVKVHFFLAFVREVACAVFDCVARPLKAVNVGEFLNCFDDDRARFCDINHVLFLRFERYCDIAIVDTCKQNFKARCSFVLCRIVVASRSGRRESEFAVEQALDCLCKERVFCVERVARHNTF